MERADRKVWDELIAFEAVAPVEDEITGIIDGLTGVESGGELHYSCGRLLTVRRLIQSGLDAVIVCGREHDGRRRCEGIFELASIEDQGFTLDRMDDPGRT